MITQDRLKSLLAYNEESGVFTWKNPTSNRVRHGDIAGSRTLNGYLSIRLDKKSYLCHRLAWLYVHGEFPCALIDHINANKQDNRICNLRDATYHENGYNSKKKVFNTSGFKGVSFAARERKFLAQCIVAGKHHFIGYFETAELAARAYGEFSAKNHGEFSRV